MLISFYFGNKCIKIFAAVAFVCRVIIIIVWGCILMFRYESHIGPKMGDSPNKDD